jgi:sulfur relay (sulfurtransferase) DsrC/TusE family protein
VKNHAELGNLLKELGLAHDQAAYDKKVVQVASCWFNLSREHLKEALVATTSKCIRSAYSRSYYAAYNASKAVRYLAYGQVSLRGDDHAKASELPDDFPNVAKWATTISTLYEHRLRADYDNWTNTLGEHTTSSADCITQAGQFMDDCAQYAKAKYGVTL